MERFKAIQHSSDPVETAISTNVEHVSCIAPDLAGVNVHGRENSHEEYGKRIIAVLVPNCIR